MNDSVEQVRLARDLGFDIISEGQHFLADPMQEFQSVALLCRLAAEAGDMRIATCILLLGLYNPVDAAEQIASLDIITQGRLRCGVGLGYRQEELDAFGIERSELRDRFVRNLEIVTDLLSGHKIRVDEPHCRIDEHSTTLRPAQRPRPPIWMGANSDAAIRRAARMADAWIMNPHAKRDTLKRQIDDIYRPALDEFGKPFPNEMPLRREIYVADDRPTAIREAAPWLFPKYQVYAQWGQDRALPEGDDFAGEFNELLQNRFIIGSPDECIAEIERYHDELGATDFLLRVQWPGMPQSHALENLRRVGTTVLPHFASQGSARSAASR